MKILTNELEKILGFDIDQDLKERLSDLEYDNLTKNERDDYINDVVNVLFNDIIKSGNHRMVEWENGWNQNLELFKQSKDVNCLIPKYHGKYNILRWNGDVIKSKTENLDYKLHICFVDAILRHYINDCDNVYEFGCGPGYHLIRLNNFNKKLNLFGSDWTKSSQNIINEINNVLGIEINAFNFDFLQPDYKVNILKNSAIYTVAALEQVGENFKDFVNYLLIKSPKICIHMEPIDELLDCDKLIDNLSVKYFRKRNYLNGFLPYLENLEKEGKVEIIKKQRIYYGSYFIEGHSLIVWRPKK